MVYFCWLDAGILAKAFILSGSFLTMMVFSEVGLQRKSYSGWVRHPMKGSIILHMLFSRSLKKMFLILQILKHLVTIPEFIFCIV